MATDSLPAEACLTVMQSDVNRLKVMQSVPNCLDLAPWTYQLGQLIVDDCQLFRGYKAYKRRILPFLVVKKTKKGPGI